jgi:uncharacterized membrane protein (DUF485 family)
MGYRIMQVVVSLLGILFALAALRAFKEPWAKMDSVMATQVAAGYLIAAVLAVVCIVAAQQFGAKAREIKDRD